MRIGTINRVGVLYQIVRPNRSEINQSSELIERHSSSRSLDHDANRNTADALSTGLQVLYGSVNQCARRLNLLWYSHHRQHEAKIISSSNTQNSTYLWQKDFFRPVEGQADAAPTQKGIRF